MSLCCKCSKKLEKKWICDKCSEDLSTSQMFDLALNVSGIMPEVNIRFGTDEDIYEMLTKGSFV